VYVSAKRCPVQDVATNEQPIETSTIATVQLLFVDGLGALELSASGPPPSTSRRLTGETTTFPVMATTEIEPARGALGSPHVGLLRPCTEPGSQWAARMHELQERKEAEGRSRMLEFSLSLFATEEILKAQNAELQQQLDAEREAACELQRRLDERMGVERQARDRVIERMQEELRRAQRQLVQEERTAREARRAHREAVERHSQQMCETASEVEAATTAALATAQRAQEDAERAQAGTLCALARANGEPAALAALPLGELEELEGSAEAALARIRERLAEARSEERKDRQCAICMDAVKNIAFVPCGHQVCAECASPIARVCPFCKAAIAHKMRTY
jgi:hypothetical protein